MQPQAPLLQPSPDQLPLSLHSLGPLPGIRLRRGSPDADVAASLHEIHAHSLVAVELGFQGLEREAQLGCGVVVMGRKGEGAGFPRRMGEEKVGIRRERGSEHLVFLQGDCDLTEVPSQGQILHLLSEFPQAGLLLLTVVQELCPLSGLLQQGPPERQQGPSRDLGGCGGWEESSLGVRPFP